MNGSVKEAILLAPVLVAIITLTAAVPKAVADDSGDWNQGNSDGKSQADSDFQGGNGMNLHCGFEHSNNYCLGYRAGYIWEWGVDSLAHGGR